MNPDVRVANAALDLHVRTQRCGKRDLRVSSMDLRRCGTDECERNRVLSWIAALQMRCAVVRMRRLRVVFVSGRSVMVLRMIVIAVGVGVERRHHAGRRNQRRNEQRRQGAMHNDESMRRPRGGQNDDRRLDPASSSIGSGHGRESYRFR